MNVKIVITMVPEMPALSKLERCTFMLNILCFVANWPIAKYLLTKIRLVKSKGAVIL